jgi:hypothetical protein
MKKIFFILGLIVLISCDKDADLEIYESESLTYFSQSTSATYFVENGDSEFKIPVGVTDASDVDREFSVRIIEEESNAAPESYILPETFVVEAGSYISDVVVKGIFDEVVDGKSIVIELAEINGSSIADFDNKFEVTFFRFCEYNQETLAGEWTFTSEFWGREYNVELIAGEDEFSYLVNLYGPLEGLIGLTNTQTIEINVNQITSTSFEASVATQVVFDANTPIFAANYGPMSITGSGSFDTCGEISMSLAFRVGAGSFGSYAEVLTKN